MAAPPPPTPDDRRDQRADGSGTTVELHREALGIDHVTIDGRPCAVAVRRRLGQRFATAVELTPAGMAGQPPVLVVPPLSAHLPILLRDLVAGLLQSAPVVVLEWHEPRHVPLSAGRFGFDDNVLHIEAALRDLGPETLVIALCQAVVPTLAAAARIAEDSPTAAPRGLVLIAGPVDPLANPTRVVRLLRARSLDWFAANVIATVGSTEPGAGRRVYPASDQRAALLAYLARHLGQGGELSWKVFYDDGSDPYAYPFLTLFLSLMDLPADLFLENIATVFHNRAICTGGLRVAGRPVDLTALRRTALLTIEGEHDDIAAPGQTDAAHHLCTALPPPLHHRLLVKGSGHFSLFYGRVWRNEVLPAITRFDRATRAGDA